MQTGGKIGRRPLLGGLIGAAAGLAVRPLRAQPQSDPIVETASGRVRGSVQNGVSVFRGIRYGAPTGGANRFLPPVPVTPWAGIADALAFANSAPQVPTTTLGPLGDWYNVVEPLSEDCLFLNVWTPTLNAARRPVMVWLHGGAWVNCVGTAPGFDGASLAQNEDVVVVTLNHRLNVFGYLALGGDDERFADTANAGILDMVAALRWVRDNASAFGGDPGNVTIFGQSGGAAKVAALMGLPAAKGLFHRAIMQSCSGGLDLRSVAEGDRQTRALAAALGLDRPSGPSLQSIPADQLLAASLRVSGPFRPSLDGRSFKANPFDLSAPVSASDIPLLIGNAATELTLFMAVDMGNFRLDRDEALRRLGRFLQIGPSKALRLYDVYQASHSSATPSELLVVVASDYMYRRNTMEAALRQAARAMAPVYAYVFDWQTPVLGGVLRSPHTCEVPFVFGTTSAAAGLLGTGPDLAALTRQIQPRWAAFARGGAPEVQGLASWTPYDPVTRATMMLDVESHMALDPGGATRSTMNGLPFYNYGMPSTYARS